MTTPNQHHEFQQPDKPEHKLVRGRLMAVDWANGTARLDTPKGESVSLRFSVADIDMENSLRKLATCHVVIRAICVTSGNVRESETISIQEISHAWLEPEPPTEPKDGPISEEEWAEYMRAIRESRDGLCGECRGRVAAV